MIPTIHNTLHLINQRNFKQFSKQWLPNLHLNIRSINNDFEAFKQFYLSLKYNFTISRNLGKWLAINKTPLLDYQITILNIRSENQGEEEVCVFLLMNYLFIR